MDCQSHVYVLSASDFDENEIDEACVDLASALGRHTIDAEVFASLGKIVVIASEDAGSPETIGVFAEEGHDVEEHWISGSPSGRKLKVDLLYHDENQTVSANIDEQLLLDALKNIDPGHQDDRLAFAVIAFASDNEFTFGYGPKSGNMSVSGVYDGASPWNEAERRIWSGRYWDPDEPMLDLSFQPQAALSSGGNLINVHVDGVSTSWQMPVRLLPKGFDPEDDYMRDDLASLPCAPEKVRLWVTLCPYEVEILNPEIIPDLSGDGPEI